MHDIQSGGGDDITSRNLEMISKSLVNISKPCYHFLKVANSLTPSRTTLMQTAWNAVSASLTAH